MHDQLFEALLFEAEGSALDFKRDQYPFYGATDDEKSELLKDILAFANGWRRDNAYILVGVEDAQGGRSRVVGVTTHLKDNDLQQFVNSKTQRAVVFRYIPYEYEGKQLGIIEIPVQPRPLYLQRAFGRLRAQTVYVRQGSATAVATPDEVSHMGALLSPGTGRVPSFEVEFLEWTSQECVGTSVTLLTQILDPTDLPRPRERGDYYYGILDTLQKSETEYFEELVQYVRELNYFALVGFCLRNTGTEAGRNTLVVITIPKNLGLKPVDTARVKPSRSSFPSVVRGLAGLGRPADPDPDVKEFFDHWKVTIPFGLLHPKSERLTTSPLWLGADAPVEGDIACTVYGENVPDPPALSLRLSLVPSSRAMTVNDLTGAEANESG